MTTGEEPLYVQNDGRNNLMIFSVPTIIVVLIIAVAILYPPYSANLWFFALIPGIFTVIFGVWMLFSKKKEFYENYMRLYPSPLEKLRGIGTLDLEYSELEISELWSDRGQIYFRVTVRNDKKMHWDFPNRRRKRINGLDLHTWLKQKSE